MNYFSIALQGIAYETQTLKIVFVMSMLDSIFDRARGTAFKPDPIMLYRP